MLSIGILLDWMNPNITETVRLLNERGAKVNLIYPDQQTIDLSSVRVENDLYVIKSGTDLSMSMAGCLHAQGAATLNPYPTVAMMRNKIIVTRALEAAGIPTPQTFIGNDLKTVIPLLESGPLILKPYRGTRGIGVSVIWDPSSLIDLVVDGPFLVQRYHKPDEPDNKIFNIGGELFGIKRIWPIRKYEDKLGAPFTVTPELAEIALRCGQVFGIDLYGVDVVISDGAPYVVDINKFGSYMGVPDAPRRLADYIYAYAQRAIRRELSPVGEESVETLALAA
jgi:ribosomal protein S6--L-glutamate ligase